MLVPKKTDRNHREIMELFRKIGAVVDDTSAVGRGFPDIIINYRGLFAAVEIKSDDKAKLTKPQINWHSLHSGLSFVVRSADDVLAVFSAIDKICDGLSFIPKTQYEQALLEVMHDPNS